MIEYAIVNYKDKFIKELKKIIKKHEDDNDDDDDVGSKIEVRCRENFHIYLYKMLSEMKIFSGTNENNNDEKTFSIVFMSDNKT